MPTIKVVLKSIDVDLNYYYPQFPSKLRRAIDEGVMELAGGDRRVHKGNGSHWAVARNWTSAHSGKLTDDSRVCTIGSRPPVRGQLRVLYNALERTYKKEQFLMADAKKMIESLIKNGNLPKTIVVTNTLTNLWRGQSLEVRG
jgi:hypothetical protein